MYLRKPIFILGLIFLMIACALSLYLIHLFTQPPQSEKPATFRTEQSPSSALELKTGLSFFRQLVAKMQDVRWANLKVQGSEAFEVQGRYLLTGTVVLDRGVESASRRADGSLDYSHPFSGLSTYAPESYDAWVADLECPISSQDIPELTGYQTFEFNCLPGYLEHAKKYFKFYNLANNHSDNSGQEKLEETRRRLAEAGVQAFGDPNPDNRDAACEVVSLPVRLVGGDGAQKANLPLAFCAWHYYHRLPQAGEIEVLKQYAEMMPVFAFVHMGAEYKTEADRIQTRIARRVIDAGAEFVIGNNPHWVQNAEIYKGKLIVYSTGNFIFDQDWNNEVSQSANIVVDLRVTNNSALQPWLDLAESCQVAADSCLEAAKNQNLTPYTFDLQFDVIAGYITLVAPQRRATAAIQRAVEKRLGWANLNLPQSVNDSEVQMRVRSWLLS